jgi:hypothetical protein
MRRLSRLLPIGASLVLLSAASPASPQKDSTFAAPLAWQKLQAGPPARFAFTAVLAPKTDSVLVFAGETKKGTKFDFFKDLWEHDIKNDTWREVATKGDAPGVRAYHSAAFDTKRDTMWVFGGAGRKFDPLDELWKIDTATWTWTKLAPSGEQPGARFNAGLHYDAKRDQLVLWSGCKAFFKEENAWPDLWTYDIEKNTWSKKSSAAPDRWQAASVLAPDLDMLIVHGGYDGKSVVQAETWTYQLDTDKWTEIGKGYKSTDAHIAVWDPLAQVMIVHGGATAARVGLNGLSAYDPKKKKWTPLNPKGADPGPRAYHATVWCPSIGGIWTFGGTVNQFMDDQCSNEVWTIALHKM